MNWIEYATNDEKRRLARLDNAIGKSRIAYITKRAIRDRCVGRMLRRQKKGTDSDN